MCVQLSCTPKHEALGKDKRKIRRQVLLIRTMEKVLV